MKKIWGSRWMLAGALVVTAGTAGLAGVAAAENGLMPHGMHGHDNMMAANPAAMDAHLEKMIATMLPDGTAAQKARLMTIAKAVHADLGATHTQFGQAHQRLHSILVQPVVDRAALEAVRVEQMHQMDVTSKRIVDALADAAEVMTPEQRARVGEHLKQHMK